MKTLDIEQLYAVPYLDDYDIPDGEEYSNFSLGFVKNFFPKHTIVGKLLGSNNKSRGIKLSDIIGEKKKKQSAPKTKQYVAPALKSVPEKKDHKKLYMIGGGVLLVIIILAVVLTYKK